MNTPWLASLEQRLLALAPNPPQGLCLVGVPGLGQEQLAERFAQAILSTQDLSLHPDYLLIAPEPGKSIGIDTVREISDFCLISPTKAQRKIVLIQAADSLTLPAQQAFLKTLEEPVVPTSFILVCSQAHKLLPTLRSRCQQVAIPSVPYSQAGVSISPELYALSDGAPLMLAEPEFQNRQLAYACLKESLAKKSLSPENFKTLSKAEPRDVLTGFYYAAMHLQRFELLDRCIALRKLYSENPNLNWEMNLNSFLIEANNHAR